jgi:ArpU family phage transcriptional regulator
VLIVGLIPEIDKTETIQNVRNFFSEDKYYPTIKRRSGEYGLKSPQMDITGVHGSRFGNSSEKMMMMFTEYSQANRAVDDAIKGCRLVSQIIIQKRYIERLEIYRIRPLINRYGHETYDNADKYACLEFADCLERKAWENNVDREIIPNLLVFKNRS